MALDQQAIEEMAGHLGIQRLLAAFADAMNRRAWHELSALFLADAKIELTPWKRPPIVVTGPEALGRFIHEATERFGYFQFVLLNSRIELALDTDSAQGRNFICEYRRDKASGDWTQVFGVYHDRFRRIAGRWWFAHRTFHPLASNGSDNVLFDVPPSLAALFAEPL